MAPVELMRLLGRWGGRARTQQVPDPTHPQHSVLVVFAVAVRATACLQQALGLVIAQLVGVDARPTARFPNAHRVSLDLQAGINVDDAAMSNSPDAFVTVIGLGLMGRALAGVFLTAGHPTAV